MSNQTFPAGGERQAVYNFLTRLGFVASSWSDKHWKRADGIEVHVFGAGSMARIGSDEFPLGELPEHI